MEFSLVRGRVSNSSIDTGLRANQIQNMKSETDYVNIPQLAKQNAKGGMKGLNPKMEASKYASIRNAFCEWSFVGNSTQFSAF